MKESNVSVDIARNRLYVTVGGRLSKQGLEELYTDIRFGVADLKQGFAVVNDLSACTLAALSGLRTFKQIMAFLASHGVEQVIRIVRAQSVVLRQILNFTARTQGYTALYVSSMAEAEAELEKAGRRKGLRFYLYQQPVQYMMGEVKGDGLILDISTGGCAVVSATLKPSVDDRVQIFCTFKAADNLLTEFKTSADIIRAKDDTFAVRFLDLDDALRERLWKRLIHESQCERA